MVKIWLLFKIYVSLQCQNHVDFDFNKLIHKYLNLNFMRNFLIFKKALWLVILLTCGMVSVYARTYRDNGLVINNDSVYILSMSADNTNFPLTVSYAKGDGWEIINPIWYNMGGGIKIMGVANSETVVISSLVNDTTYATGFGRFAKGKLRFECTLRKEIFNNSCWAYSYLKIK